MPRFRVFLSRGTLSLGACHVDTPTEPTCAASVNADQCARHVCCRAYVLKNSNGQIGPMTIRKGEIFAPRKFWGAVKVTKTPAIAIREPERAQG